MRPTPFAEQNGETFLHIIVEVNRRPRSPLQPVLLGMRELASLSISRPIWCVGLLPEDFDTDDVFDLCLPVCERHQLLIPRGGTTREWMGPRQSRRAHAGLFIPIWWDERLTLQEAQRLHPGDEESEESAFMQRVAPSVSPNLAQTRIVGRNNLAAIVNMDVTEPFMQQLESAWPFSRRDFTEVEAAHVVSDPPTFAGRPSDTMYIVEFSDDRFHQTHPDDVLLLTTIIFGSLEGSKEESHVKSGFGFIGCRRRCTTTTFWTSSGPLRYAGSLPLCANCTTMAGHGPWQINPSGILNLAITFVSR